MGFGRTRTLGPWVAAASSLLWGVGGHSAIAAESHPLAPPRALAIEATLLPSAPVLDGRMDEGWPAKPTVVIDRSDQVLVGPRQPWAGAGDASVRGWLGRHGDDLYVALELRDDHVVHDPGQPWWHGDSVELFLDADRPANGPASTSYGENCWQIFLLPANPDLDWGVVYRGRHAHHGDGGLRGVRVAHHRIDDTTTVEARIPLRNFAVSSRAPVTWGFALAVNDVDPLPYAPPLPATYLSWNAGFDLFKRPDHFGTLSLPAPPAETPLPNPGPGWTWLWAALCGAVLAFLLAGPLGHWVRRVGWKPKAVGLVTVGAAALALHVVGSGARDRTRAQVRNHLEVLARRAARVVEDAQAVGALQEAQEAERQASLHRLLCGDGVRCHPGVEASAFVPLHEDGIPPPKRGRAESLGQARRWPLAMDRPIEAMEIACSLPARHRPRSDPLVVGTFELEARDGSTYAHVVRLDPASDTDWTEVLRPPTPKVFAHLVWTPDPRGTTASLSALTATRGEARTLLWTPRRTEDGVPVLAHTASSHAGRTLHAGEVLRVPVPVLLGGADRLWLVMTSEHAYPDILGDQPLATVQVTHALGPAHAVTLRNGEHLSATRMPVRTRRPAGVRSRVAWREGAGSGFARVQHAIAVPLHSEQRPGELVIENRPAGGALTVLAATVVRSRRPGADSVLQVVFADDAASDRCYLVDGADTFLPHLRTSESPSEGARERLRTHVGPDDRPTPLELVGDVPSQALVARERVTIALFACLGLGAVLFVLLVIDWTDRVGRLSYRLALGVLAAALVPFTVTLLLVDRNQRRGVEADATSSVRATLDDVEAQVRHVAGRAGHAAEAIARQLQAAGSEAMRSLGTTGEATAALEPHWAATAWIRGVHFPPVHLPLSSQAGGLSTPRFLGEVRDRPGVHVSPWDGGVAVGTAQVGSGDSALHVVVGIRLDGTMLMPGAAQPPRAVLLLDRHGTALAAAGDGTASLQAALSTQSSSGDPLSLGVRPFVTPSAVIGLVALREHRVGEAESPLLAVGIARHHLARMVAEDRTPLIWLGLLGLTFMVCAAALVARHVARPVQALADASDAVRMGDFDVVVPMAGRDEVGRLTRSFDQMRQGLRARMSDLATLRDAQEQLGARLDFDTQCASALRVLRDHAGADRAGYLSAQSARGPVTWVAEQPAPEGDAPAWTDRPFGLAPSGALATALRGVEPQVLAADGPAGAGAEQRLLERSVAWLAVPLRSGDHPLGLVLLGWDDAVKPEKARRSKLLAPLVGIVTAALNNAHLYRLAALDEVTGLPGATAFEAALRRDVEGAVGGGVPVTLLRVAVDNVDHVRRERGEAASHALLRATAHALVAVVGDPLHVGRTRTNELAVRLVATPAGHVREVAQAMRARARTLELPVDEDDGESLRSTLSIGMASCPGDARSVEFLFDAAGRALACAQREGGDRVEDVARIDAGAVDVPPFEEGAVFRNERMVAVVEAARRAARADASVLITGETGTGKEVIANLIHRRSTRARRPFVSVNCAAFPESLLESELFGYERGAFTGAERRREGRFELADGGTLFLDEIGDLAPPAQVKLLRVLQERQFTRLGGTRTVTVDVRIVAATNRDLESRVARGTFREDLYYRLNVIRLAIPPLRERREEIPPLVEKFLRDFRRRSGAGPHAMSPAAMDVLYRHPWPGNIRELKNVVERCAVLCDQEVVQPHHLQLDGGRPEGLAPRRAPMDDLNHRQRKLLDHLARHGRCTNRQYYEMTETSPRTGLRDLQDLMHRGLLVREGKRRGAVYRLP